MSPTRPIVTRSWRRVKPFEEDPELRVFDRAEIAKIVGIPVTRVKDWSIGRPLDIKPSIRVSRRRGSPNFYSESDILRFALAKQLSTDGLTSIMIQRALDKWPKKGIPTLLCIAGDGDTTVRFSQADVPLFDWAVTLMPEQESVLGHYFLNLQELFKRVKEQIEKAIWARKN